MKNPIQITEQINVNELGDILAEHFGIDGQVFIKKVDAGYPACTTKIDVGLGMICNIEFKYYMESSNENTKET